MKVCFLMTSDKPVPAIRGGAIEGLVQILIDEHEKSDVSDFEFTVLTIKDKRINYNNYKKTRFIFIPAIYILGSKVYWKIVGAVRIAFGKELLAPLPKRYEKNFVNRNKDKYDLFIEETNLDAIEKLEIDKKKIVYHLHYEGNPTKQLDLKTGHIIAISQYIALSWISATGRKKEDVSILKNCIDNKKFKKKLLEEEIQLIKENLMISEDDFVILYVGRIVEEKGVIELINAVNKINDNVSLIIIGSSNFDVKQTTEYEKKVKIAIDESTKNIQHLGYVDNGKIYEYQALADIQVVPSIWQEPAGLVVLEAQAAGVPVIASKVGGIPEFVGNESGILVKVDDKFETRLAEEIQKLLRDVKRRQHMSFKAKEYAKNYTTESYYFEFLKILKLIEGK